MAIAANSASLSAFMTSSVAGNHDTHVDSDGQENQCNMAGRSKFHTAIGHTMTLVHICLLSAALAAAFFASTPSTRADDLVILSAAAVRPGLNEVPALFSKATGHRVKLTFGNATAIE